MRHLEFIGLAVSSDSLFLHSHNQVYRDDHPRAIGLAVRRMDLLRWKIARHDESNLRLLAAKLNSVDFSEDQVRSSRSADGATSFEHAFTVRRV